MVGKTKKSGLDRATRLPGENAWKDYLRQLRLEAGLTQKEAAAQAGLSAIFISLIENGKQKPSVRSLDRLARTYNADLDEMLHLLGYPKDALLSPPRATLMAPATPLDEKRVDWALRAIADDYEYSLVPNWMSLPKLTKALLIRIYQMETGRSLLRKDETLALSHIIHGVDVDADSST